MSLIAVLGLATESFSKETGEILEEMRVSAFESCLLASLEKLVANGYKVKPYDLFYFLNYAQSRFKFKKYRDQAGLITQFLIDHGADVNYTYYQNTSLMSAAWYGLDNVVEILLKNGANVNQKYDAVKAKNPGSRYDGANALGYACLTFDALPGNFMYDQIHTIQLLLAHGAVGCPQVALDLSWARSAFGDPLVVKQIQANLTENPADNFVFLPESRIEKAKSVR